METINFDELHFSTTAERVLWAVKVISIFHRCSCRNRITSY